MKVQKNTLLTLLMSTVLLTGCLSDDDDAKAEAGANVSVKERRSIVLSTAEASGEGAVTVTWTQISGPQLSLSGADTLTPQITAPSLDADATAVLRLTVTDSKGQIAEDDLTVNVTNNTLPALTAGLDAIAEKTEVELTAPLSDDGEITTVSWLQTAGPVVTLVGAGTNTVSFSTPAVTELTELTFLLTVTDDDNETAELQLSVEIEPNLVALTLSGSLNGADFSGGAAVLTGAQQNLTTEVNDNGAFSFELLLDDDLLDNVVAVSVTSQTSSRLKYSAVYSGFNRPETTSTAALVANPEQSNVATQLSNTVSVNAVSTALYALLVAANAGEMPTNIEQLVIVEKSIDADELTEAAAVVKILTENAEIALPEGVTDITALLVNIAAYNTIVEQIEAAQPGLIADTVVAIIADPTLTPPLTADTVPSEYIQTYATASGFLSRWGAKWQLGADGTGANADSFGDNSFAWQINDGSISVVYDNAGFRGTGFAFFTVGSYGLTEQQVQWLHADNIFQIQVNYYTPATVLTRITEGQLVDTYRRTDTNRTVIPEINTTQGVIALPDLVNENSSNVIMRKQTNSTAGFTAEQMPGMWAIYTHYIGLNFPSFHLDPLTFNANGTGSGSVTGRSFTWQVNDGVLSISLSDASVVTAKVIDQQGSDLLVFLTAYDSVGNVVAAQAEYAFKVGSQINATNLVNDDEKYWQRMDLIWETRYWQDGHILFCYRDPSCSDEVISTVFFGWHLDSDFSGTNLGWSGGELPPNLDIAAAMTPITWSYDAGVLTKSFRTLIRQWTPLKIETGKLGRRLYALEKYFSANTGAVSIPERLAMYEEIDYEYWNTNPTVVAAGLNTVKLQRKVLKPSKLNNLSN